MEQETEVVVAKLPNGVEVGVEVAAAGGTGNVGVLDQLDFQEVQRIIEGLAQVVGHALQQVKPQSATAELGLSLKVETGTLTAVLVKAGGDASIKVSLTWESGAATDDAPAAAGVDGEAADAGAG